MVSISIVICTFNRCNLLFETLESIEKNGINKLCQVIVINNNSKDSTKDVKINFPWVDYHEEYNQGLSYARNKGYCVARGDVILYIDDDVDVDKNILNYTLSGFSSEAVGAVGGKVLPFNHNSIPDWIPVNRQYLVSVFDIGDKIMETKKLMGANFAIRKKILHDIGGFDVGLGRSGGNLMGGEEIDVIEKIKNKKYKIIYNPKSIVYHKINSKLNIDYIRNYSFELGKSERIMDSRKFLKKIFKFYYIKYFTPFINIKCRVFSSSKSANTAIEINNFYMRGYIYGERE
ncbi:glycosyltransferase family 2 protein [Sphaerotilus natans]|uniref:glycosyltransferase family 2 protein n=1 Tax=Sphaerotilus natans TaxID=34103 RepID=UPI00406C257D